MKVFYTTGVRDSPEYLTPWSGPAKGRRDASTGSNVQPRTGQRRADGQVLWIFSNVSKVKRKKAQTDDQIPYLEARCFWWASIILISP